jgi:hypothetical protein
MNWKGMDQISEIWEKREIELEGKEWILGGEYGFGKRRLGGIWIGWDLDWMDWPAINVRQRVTLTSLFSVDVWGQESIPAMFNGWNPMHGRHRWKCRASVLFLCTYGHMNRKSVSRTVWELGMVSPEP